MTAVASDRRRRRAFFAIGLCAVAVVAIVVLAVVLSENVVYFRTVSEAEAPFAIHAFAFSRSSLRSGGFFVGS